MKNISRLFLITSIFMLSMESCSEIGSGTSSENLEIPVVDNFQYFTEQFADLKILRYQIPGFNSLDLNKKILLYYLYEAALSGRDIIYDQNYKHNLSIKRTLEAIVNLYKGDRNTDDFKKFMHYTKRVWFSNGIHHHYSSKKILPEFTKEYFAGLIRNTKDNGGSFPLQKNQSLDEFISNFALVIFDPEFDSKRINLDPTVDMIAESANNYYEGLTQKEVEEYYKKVINKNDTTPVSYGLNSKLVKEGKIINEKTWKVGGMYSAAIERIVYWLEKATTVAENESQKTAIQKLIEYYKTGDLKKFDEYNILWVQDTASMVDVTNGFIEVYGDALGYRGAYESVVSFKDIEATKRIAAISREAQWFEDNSPLMNKHKKTDVTGISARVITVVVEAGDASPTTPIGINLPNSNWVRTLHGSKSVNLGNIVHANNKSHEKSGVLAEFAFSTEEVELSRKYGALADNLHTDMHEVIGHASGQLNKGVGTPTETLKNYASCLEEARADLVALYYLMDKKLIDIGVMPSLEVGKAAYNDYIRKSLITQLTKVELGEDLEEAHMRNRQLVALWVYEKGRAENIIEKITKDEKTFFLIHDYNKLRTLFGDLLREIQRIKSEGDYKAGSHLVESYGVRIDKMLHAEVLNRYAKLNVSPYAGFISPRLTPVIKENKITDIKVEYPDNFTEQMLYYAEYYTFLPDYN